MGLARAGPDAPSRPIGEYLEAREDVAVNTADAFFDVHSARLALDNAAAKVAINDTLFNLNKGRFEVGKIGENDLLQSELALLQARAQLDGAKLDFDRADRSAQATAQPPAGRAARDHAANRGSAHGGRYGARGPAGAEEPEPRHEHTSCSRSRRSARVTEAKLNNGFGATVTATVGFNQRASVLDDAYRISRSASNTA